MLDNRKFLWCAKRHSLCWRWTSRQSPPVSSGCVALSWSKFFGRICINIFISITITVLIVIIMIMIFILKGTVPLKIRCVFFVSVKFFWFEMALCEFSRFLGSNSAHISIFTSCPNGRGDKVIWTKSKRNHKPLQDQLKVEQKYV